MQDDAGEYGHSGFDMIPKPDGDALTGWVFKAGKVVEQIVVQLLDERIDDLFQVRKIHDPAELCIKRAIHIDAQAIGVPVDAAAFVVLRHMRQEMGRVEGEIFEKFHGWQGRAGLRAGNLAFS